jgi:Uma2 family endonuclease
MKLSAREGQWVYMSQPSPVTEFGVPLKLKVQAIKLTNEQFARLCQENPDLRLELTAQQELVIMSPTGSRTGRRNSRLTRHLDVWAETDGSGVAFDSSTMFTLPNGAIRSPDASWVRRARWDALTEDQQEGFAPLCPDFVVELRSRTDRLSDLHDKMQEYIDNGARLGWLIDPIDKRVYVYRPSQPVESLDNPATLSGDPVLLGFMLPVHELW